MTTLFGRTYAITIGRPGEEGKRWSGSLDDPESLQIGFEVEMKSSGVANKLRLEMLNLSTASTGFIEQEGNTVRLIAGYAGSSALLFYGDIAAKGVTSTKDRETRTTTIEAGASERSIQTARTSRSYVEGTSMRTILTDVAADLGVGILDTDSIEGIDARSFSTGWTFFGNSRSAVNELVTQLGPDFTWTIQDGQLQILNRGQAIRETAVVLRSNDFFNTGVIGAPQRQKNGLEMNLFLMPTLKPGRIVQVKSLEFDGFYKVKQVSHSGSYREGDWSTKIVCSEL